MCDLQRFLISAAGLLSAYAAQEMDGRQCHRLRESHSDVETGKLIPGCTKEAGSMRTLYHWQGATGHLLAGFPTYANPVGSDFVNLDQKLRFRALGED